MIRIIPIGKTMLEMIEEKNQDYDLQERYPHDISYYQEIIKYVANQSANKSKDDKNNRGSLIY